ncbi:hypothetical protein FA95DRAFT_1567326 [Auriscalpium vulgare]|uniref:Uncharacterized protein n=1 Tax=Auriscalpium vulgare TaxID=40419 RepID=A0ACB8R695_9AGAM|nr:hypothetical protein FA95DRAFT_1567326 [Auriscalpium vulgare]
MELRIAASDTPRTRGQFVQGATDVYSFPSRTAVYGGVRRGLQRRPRHSVRKALHTRADDINGTRKAARATYTWGAMYRPHSVSDLPPVVTLLWPIRPPLPCTDTSIERHLPQAMLHKFARKSCIPPVRRQARGRFHRAVRRKPRRPRIPPSCASPPDVDPHCLRVV